MKPWLWTTLAAALCAGSLCACASGGKAPAEDPWQPLTDPDWIAGSWVGRAESVIPAGGEMRLSEPVTLGFEVTFTHAAGEPDIVATHFLDMRGLVESLVAALETASGEELDDEARETARANVWAAVTTPVLKAFADPEARAAALMASVSAAPDFRFVLTLVPQPAADFIASDERGDMAVNAARTRIRWRCYTPLTLGMGDAGFSEMVFVKR